MTRSFTGTSLTDNIRAYVGALLIIGTSIAMRTVMSSIADVQVPFLFAFPAVVVISMWLGLGPGLVAVLVTVAWDICVPGQDASSVLRASMFAPAGSVTAILCATAMGRKRAIDLPRQPLAAADNSERSGTKWLSSLFIASAVVPAIFFAVAAWQSYLSTTARADDDLDRAARIVEEHALKVFEANEVLNGRIGDILEQANDAANGENERELHNRLAQASRGIAQVQAISAWDRAGHAIASSGMYPMPVDFSIASRDYFIRLKNGSEDVIITAPETGPLSRERIFFVAERRLDSHGEFNGLSIVALFPAYFERFYRELADSQPTLTLSLIRGDGTVLTRFPSRAEDPPRVAPTTLLMQHVLRREPAGHFETTSRNDGGVRIIGFRRVGSYPLYVVAGVDQAAVLSQWLRYIQILAAFIFPTSLALVYVTWRALRTTRRDLLAADELAQESRRRLVAESALREVQKLEALGRLTGGVAHDFNNLLSVMSNNLYILEHRQPDGLSRQFAAMRRAVKSGERLTRQLLAFSRRQPMHPETISLASAMPGLRELLGHTIGRLVELSIQVEEPTALVSIDSNEFELALINLAVNAKDAMPDGGLLDIRAGNAKDGSDFVEIVVSDGGTGIATADLPHIFEPFFTTKDVGKGTGLGLSQVYGFCVQSGGSLAVRNGIGGGAVFTMRLPKVSGTVAAPETTNPVSAAPGLAQRILVVDDNPEVAYTTCLMLREAGATVTQVEDASTALDVLRRERYDAMVSDIMMPGGRSGISLAIEARESFPHMRIVLVSGYTSELELAESKGFTVLAKPCEFDALRSALDADDASVNAP